MSDKKDLVMLMVQERHLGSRIMCYARSMYSGANEKTIVGLYSIQYNVMIIIM